MLRFLCVLPLIGAAVQAPAADDVVFRSNVSLVRVDARVVDRNNRGITGLHQEDFILREEGRPQQIRNFSSENMPVDVLLLLDVSASMRPHVERIASAAHQALRVLGDQDRVAIMVFDRFTRVRLPFRDSRADVEREFENLLRQETFNGGTDITRGLLDAASYIGRQARPGARRAIVILTDDQTERNRDEEAVSRALTRADAVLMALIAPDAMRNRSGYPGGRGRMPRGGGGSWPNDPGMGGPLGGPLGGIILGRRGPYGGRGPVGGPGGGGPVVLGGHTQSAGTAEIARRSGGDSLSVDDASALETALARIRQSYALHFYLPAGVQPGQERNIEVELADAARRRYPDAEVRYRRVYLTPGSGGPSTPAEEPVVVSQAPASSGDAAPAGKPGWRRRPAVDEPGGPRGPAVGTGDDAAAGTPSPATQPQPASTGGWRRTDDPAQQPAPAATPTPPPATPPSQGGWRRVKPGEQP